MNHDAVWWKLLAVVSLGGVGVVRARPRERWGRGRRLGAAAALALRAGAVTVTAMLACCAAAEADTFSSPGVHHYAVPAGVHFLDVTLDGAEGGPGDGIGGPGGHTTALLQVQPGTVVEVRVGGRGVVCSGSPCASDGGFNGGGKAALHPAMTTQHVGSGGGATDVRVDTADGVDDPDGALSLADRVLVAGGGGGGGSVCAGGPGGAPVGGAGCGSLGSVAGTPGAGGDANPANVVPLGVPMGGGAGGGGGYVGGAARGIVAASIPLLPPLGPGGGDGGTGYVGGPGVFAGATGYGTHTGDGAATLVPATNPETTFSAPGYVSYTVPPGVRALDISMGGGQGGRLGGEGGLTSGTLAVTPGQVLDVRVGGWGGQCDTPALGLCPATGGANGGGVAWGIGGPSGGSGGGATDVRVTSTGEAPGTHGPGDRVLVAGGGGGGFDSAGCAGGAGGGTTPGTGCSGGGAGGPAGTTDGQGGSSTPTSAGKTAGGGGGYVGGNGGAPNVGGGDGGSGYIGGAGVTHAKTTTGGSTGNGFVTIKPVRQVVYDTPGRDSFTVPAGVRKLRIALDGAQGGGEGGEGGHTVGTLAVTPGQILDVLVGGEGDSCAGGSCATGVNGGGATIPTTYNGTGGGASDVRVTTTGEAPGSYGPAGRVLVAGGGGGGGGDAGSCPGGAGGGLVPGTGCIGAGAAGTPDGQGGAGGQYGGGGGGGYVGGAAGASPGGGSGGTGYIGGPGVTDAQTTTGGRSGDGRVVITIPNPVQTSVACTPASPHAVDATTCTATVSDPGLLSVDPVSGTVSFDTADAGAFGSGGACTLGADGTCQVTFTRPTAGTSTIAVDYAGDRDHDDGAATTDVTAAARPTSTDVDCGASLIGAPTTCTATVSDADGGPTPAGSVTFTRDGGSVDCTLSAGSCSTTFTPAGPAPDEVQAGYGGSPVHAVSAGIADATAARREVRVTLACPEGGIAQGADAPCTASVADTSPGAATTPTGQVTFSGGATCTLTSGGCATTLRPTQTTTVTATYAGDAAHQGGSSDARVTVTAPTSASVSTPPLPPAPVSCRSNRQLSVGITLAAPRGIKLRRTVIRVNGKVKRILGRGITRFTLPLNGYPAGVAQVILKATTTTGKTLVGTRAYRLCGYTAKPPKRLTPLHAPRG
jgi:hypothetical protein